MNRRSLLKVGLAGSALLALGGIGLGLRSGRPRVPQTTLRALNPRAFDALAAAAEVLVPGGDGLPTAHEVQVAEGVDEALAHCHPGVQKEMNQVLGLLENALSGLILDGRTQCFSACDAPTRLDILVSWQNADTAVLRSAFKAIHGFCSGVYWSSPLLAPHIGYPGPQPWLLAARRAMRSTP